MSLCTPSYYVFCLSVRIHFVSCVFCTPSYCVLCLCVRLHIVSCVIVYAFILCLVSLCTPSVGVLCLCVRLHIVSLRTPSFCVLFLVYAFIVCLCVHHHFVSLCKPSHSFAIFTKGNNICEFLFASLDDKNFHMGCTYKCKNLVLGMQMFFFKSLS